MKANLLLVLALFSVTMLVGQSVSNLNKIKKVTSVDNIWNLDKYLWSHDHYNQSATSKPPLDYAALDNWVSLTKYVAISNNGKFLAYGLQKGAIDKTDSIVVQDVANSWRKAYKGTAGGAFFAEDSLYVFENGNSLEILNTTTGDFQEVTGVASYKLSAGQYKKWIGYLQSNNTLTVKNILQNTSFKFDAVEKYEFDASGRYLLFLAKADGSVKSKRLGICNLENGKIRYFENVTDYVVDAKGTSIVFKRTDKRDASTVTSLLYISSPGDEARAIWSTMDERNVVKNICLDEKGQQVAFIVNSINAGSNKPDEGAKGGVDNSVWYYRKGMSEAVLKVGDGARAINSDYWLDKESTVSFTDDGHYIIFQLSKKKAAPVTNPYGVKVDIWNYKDSLLQPNQGADNYRYSVSLNVENGHVVQLEHTNENMVCVKGEFALVTKFPPFTYSDQFWRDGFRQNEYWLISLRDGSITPLPKGVDVWYNKGGRYFVYIDPVQKSYFSLNISTGVAVKISGNVLFDQAVTNLGDWMRGDSAVLVYQDCDIWQLDLQGIKKPVNLTNGYGNKNSIAFSLLNSDRRAAINAEISNYLGEDTLLLRVFDKKTKVNGFYYKVVGHQGNPHLMYMGPCLFSKPIYCDGIDRGMIPIKAGSAKNWIVKKQGVQNAPNYYLTYDFVRFQPITDLAPHKPYNWVASSLHTFKQLDGTYSTGVLYKPEDFDPSKKYPLVITFYKHLSDQLYDYPAAKYLNAPHMFSEPAWLVSHGYLVFTPDIHFTETNWGPRVMNSLEGAAHYVKSLPYVDGAHIGAAGHSNSGRFGYYLYTHSKSFAAMSVGAGGRGINPLSTSLLDNSELEFAERKALGGGLGILWQNKTSWLDHFGIWNADKAVSPILMFYNKNDLDNARPAREMFTALRRLQKKAWWLQYDKEGHILRSANNLKDFTLRYTQFWDHYLKGAPAPLWMTKGVNAIMKGVASGYELDPARSCATAETNNCVICGKWNAQRRINK